MQQSDVCLGKRYFLLRNFLRIRQSHSPPRKDIFLWGTEFLDIPHGNDAYLLAKVSQTPKSGGFVLMIGCGAKLVNSEEFAQTLRYTQAKTS